ncbi:chemotaxis protein CheA [bacterium]|jgi:two-component system, chemotaxis family, sensor kinase CheA|nr:chemotaxis protein CheA [bacterium]MBT4335006.1 chemotaxis protein CheA [bacterium]MBT4495451.1 chemotaxis protein CheA [bacterium]MBT4763925.1 chemotaxis protein CheA [bacterium]MBT5401296.1 chemotaxis protein CheA [bacterium]
MIDLSKFKDIYVSETEDHLQKLNDNLLALEKDLSNKSLLNELMRSAHTLKSSSATMGFNDMAFLTHVLEDVFDYARNDLFNITSETVTKLFEAIDSLDNSLKSVKEKNKESDLKKVIENIKKITGVKTEGIGKSVRHEDGKPLVEKKEVKSGDNKLDELKEADKITSIKVPVERLDKLMDLTEELLIDRMRIETISGYDLDSSLTDEKLTLESLLFKLTPAVEHLSGLISNLQYLVMQARLVPLGQIFARFPRMIRDLATEKKKKINLEISGEDLEVDRTIVDKLGEPIVHLLRNALDHGIDTEGTIKLKAIREKDFVSVIVEDNGLGIDFKEVVEAAVRKNIIGNDEGNNYLSKIEKNKIFDYGADKKYVADRKQIEDILFNPRLSTNKQVTKTSGRGVGLSVVKKFSEEINGNIILESPLSKKGGTRFTLELPLTLAIINALLVKIDNSMFAIPFSSIARAVSVKPEDIKSMADQDVAVVDNMRVPLVDLERVFHLVKPLQGKKTIQQLEKESKQINKTVVLVKRGKELAGIIVDRLLNEQEIIVKPLPSVLKGVKGFSGSTILGDGETILILDVITLLQDSSKLIRV